ncbi:hypothetical protein C1H46_044902 [Malus baccata]|uniref:RRM domain-containing protein n=1 Tax=Malus baccata TaxID=106549 RepID=A0A540K5Q4_MALBA|nr:hypothetical protein C1H46_044902 [Malus baccata]
MDAKSVYSSSSSGFRTPPPYSHAQTAASKSYKYLRSYSDNHSAAPPAAMDGRAVTDGGDGDDAAADDGVPAALHALQGGSSSSSPQSVPAEASGCGVSVATAAAEAAAAAAVAVTKKQGPGDEVKIIRVGDLHHWMDETYLHGCFAHTGQVSSLKSSLFV